MKLILTIIFLFSTLLFADNSTYKIDDVLGLIEKQQQSLFEKISPSVVFIISEDKFGSGFFISEDGLIITNSHVIENAKEVIVVLSNGKKYDAKIAKRAKDDIDVALLKIYDKKVNFPFLKIENIKKRKIGSWVGTIGHGSGAIWSFNTGIISNIYNKESQKAIFQTQIPINQGSSGGPVFDKDGNVLGIITAKLNNSSNINFAIDISKVIKALDLSNIIQEEKHLFTIKTTSNAPIFIDKKTVGIGPEIITKLINGEHEVMIILNNKIKRVKINIPKDKEITIK
jgi:S1-C subfamily serine protease